MNFLTPSDLIVEPTISAVRADAARAEIARASARIVEGERKGFAAALANRMAQKWWQHVTRNTSTHRLRQPTFEATAGVLSQPLRSAADTIGAFASALPITDASALIGATYAACIPLSDRAALGVYYTPPELVSRILDGLEAGGVDWSTARIIDPACGSGAFLVQCVERMIRASRRLPADELIADVRARLTGWEIDETAAWLSQVSVDIALFRATGRHDTGLPSVRVLDSLRDGTFEPVYDCVVGNPPYGRVRLEASERERFARGLYGHANLYGLFTDLALRITRPAGVIGYVSPASFLAGEYFKNLRAVIRNDATVLQIEFVSARKGVFDAVLQETVLATYRKSASTSRVCISVLNILDGGASPRAIGNVALTGEPRAPWILPRACDQVALADAMSRMSARLHDWGYGVSTGPLVWNRHKEQICARSDDGTFPLIWAECVRPDGTFSLATKRRSHLPFFRPRRAESGWLLTREPCVLLQRTTAKEQNRRLVAALLPRAVLARHGAVVVENHLNMVKPIVDKPAVSPEVVAAFLNSSIADRAFRCLSGSVAVSAFELESLPLPGVAQLGGFVDALRRRADAPSLDAELALVYGEGARSELAAKVADAFSDCGAAEFSLSGGNAEPKLHRERARS